MLSMTVKTIDTTKDLQKAADRSIYKNVRHAAFSIRKYVRESIKTTHTPSSPGSPISTRGRARNVRNSIFVDADDKTAIIGPRFSFVGDVMQTHEFGGQRYGRRYAARPTMLPGLEANQDRFAGSFRGSIGE